MEIEIDINSCRVCLKDVGAIPLFNDHGEGMAAEMISSIFNIDIICDENLPDTVCSKCIENIKLAIKTKKNILNSEIMLNTYLAINNPITESTESFVQNNNEGIVPSKLVGLDIEQLFVDKFDDSSQEIEAVSTRSTNIYDALPHEQCVTLEIDTPSYFTTLPKIYDCKKCEFKTDTYKRLIFHMRKHSGTKLYECEQCGKEYKTRSKYIIHACIHRSNNQYKCNICSKGFKARSNLDQHLLTHKTERIIPCPHCDKTFCHMKGLRAHLLTHNEKSVVCDVCGKKFKHSTFLKYHIATIHGQGRGRTDNGKVVPHQPQQVPCELCGKFLSIHNVKGHINTIHFGEKPFTCSFCDKAFSSSTSLNYHIQYHINSKNIALDPKAIDMYLKYKCDKCDKAFTSSFFLKNHMILHSGVKEHLCPHCGKGFAFKYYVDRHVRLVHDTTNPRNSVCDICGKVSTGSSGLKAHMVAHTGETPFHCKLCDSKFRYGKSLRIHMSNKHESKLDQS